MRADSRFQQDGTSLALVPMLCPLDVTDLTRPAYLAAVNVGPLSELLGEELNTRLPDFHMISNSYLVGLLDAVMQHSLALAI